jgi:hypothetical protein
MVRARPGEVIPTAASATLSIRVDSDLSILNRYRPEGGTANQAAATYFTPMSDGDFTITELTDEPSTLNTAPVQKTVYKYIPRFNGGESYGIVWAGVLHDRPFAVSLEGLVSPQVPPDFQPVLSTIVLDTAQKVEGVSTTQASGIVASSIRDKYLADVVSPSVVKIYHVICGKLMINGQPLMDEQMCDGVTGSGFFVSPDGYIATNGHVVVGGAKDIFVNLLTTNPGMLNNFLRSSGLNPIQIATIQSRPDVLASLIARIYDLPDESIQLQNKQETILVAVGDQPVKYDRNAGPTSLMNYQETNHIKRAELVGYNYSSKDLYVIQSGQEQGFSSSDVALLKINVKNAPALGINTSRITPNQPMLLFGFPGDADNTLTDNSQLAVSVTDGTISSVRGAAGGTGKLYQSAAAASQGSSGGPAVTEEGTVFGIMTYRVSGSSQADASFSYIRDISDLVALANAKGVKLSATSSTQKLWQDGIRLYAAGHYSAAINKFSDVKGMFPAQRLVTTYASASKDAIVAGKDVPQIPAFALIIGLGLCLAAIAFAARLMIRHHAHHLIYKGNFTLPHPHSLHTS